jgi:hypothetical protein
MSHTSINDEFLTTKWSIQGMITIVRSVVTHVETYVLRKESVPEELIQGLYEAIDSIEADIISRQAAISLLELDDQNRGSDFEIAPSQIQIGGDVLQVNITQETNPGGSNAVEQGFIESENPNREDTSKCSQAIVVDKHATMDFLQNKIQVIQSVILFRMRNSKPSDTSTTSSVRVSFSVLEEEMEILDTLSKHVMGSYKPWDDQTGDLMETKLTALPNMLNSLFNEEIQEAVERGSEIDEKTMMGMVVENQKRTAILRDLNYIAKQVKEATRNMSQNSRPGLVVRL